jgi:hypothetical protein
MGVRDDTRRGSACLVVALFLNFGVLGLGLEFCFSFLVLFCWRFLVALLFGFLGGVFRQRREGPKVATWAFYMSE